MQLVRKRLTYANVMSTIAVFLVLGGATAFAATKIGTSEIKAGAITSGKIAKEAVGTAKIKNGAVNASKIGAGAVGAAQINTTGLTVPNATKAATADKATTADTATKAGSATNATNAANAAIAEGPAAFAHVAANGTVLGSRGMTIIRPTPTSTYYCISNVAFTPTFALATADYFNGSPQFDTAVQAALTEGNSLSGTGCAPDTVAFVHGVTAESDTSSAAAFFVMLAK